MPALSVKDLVDKTQGLVPSPDAVAKAVAVLLVVWQQVAPDESLGEAVGREVKQWTRNG